MPTFTEKSSLGRVTEVILLGLILISIGTYFTDLSQYATVDQVATLGRINHFLTYLFRNDVEYRILDCSHVGYVLVGLPGVLIKRLLLDRFFHLGDLVVGKIHYTSLLPYTFVSVIWCLILIFSCWWVVGRALKWNSKKERLWMLLSLFVLLNIPWLKAISKILKYDSLSTLFSCLSISLYALRLTEKKQRFFWWAFATGILATFEKNTAVQLLVFLIAVETIYVVVTSRSGNYLIFLSTLGLWGKSILLFWLIGFLLIPMAWSRPLIPFEYSAKFLFYSQSIPLALVFGVPFGGLVVLVFIRKFLYNTGRIFLQGKLLWAVTLFLIVGASGAALFQKNWLYVDKYLPDSQAESIRSDGLFVGPDYLGSSYTSLDKSPGITRLKSVLSSVRLFFYCLPEGFLLILILFPFLCRREIFSQNREGIASYMVFLAYVFFSIFSFGALMAPLESKYLTGMFLCSGFAACFIITWYFRNTISEKVIWISVWGLVIVTCKPLFETAPSYMGYNNILRSREVENHDELKLGSAPWTWNGWGEGNLSIFRWLAKNDPGSVVMADYIAPFYYPPTVRVASSVLPVGLRSVEQVQDYFRQIASKEDAKYAIITRLNVIRFPAHQLILNHFRDKAVYVDKRSGIEYTWLFRIQDLLAPTTELALN